MLFTCRIVKTSSRGNMQRMWMSISSMTFCRDRVMMLRGAESVGWAMKISRSWLRFLYMGSSTSENRPALPEATRGQFEGSTLG